MQHSCAEWIWMLDSDAFVMDLEISILDVVRAAIAAQAPAGGADIDMVLSKVGCRQRRRGSRVRYAQASGRVQCCQDGRRHQRGGGR